MITKDMATEQQLQALEIVHNWLDNPAQSPYGNLLSITGWAGTGKTTIARFIEGVDNILYVAPTGKAALVLRGKGCYGARTVHSSIYVPDEQPDGSIVWQISEESPVRKADLVVADEASMIDPELGGDLLSFGVPVLAFSDPFQLKPVRKFRDSITGKNIEFLPPAAYMLTDIKRQAENNPIIRLSKDIREGDGLRVGKYGDSEVALDFTDEDLMTYDQVLCGRNITRHKLNRRIRHLKGLDSNLVSVGDKLVCLKNNRKKGLLNGGLWTVIAVDGTPSHQHLVLNSLDTTQTEVGVIVPNEFFLGTEDSLTWKEKASFDEFTYGDVMTVHKSQGSQWDKVLLIDESRAFRGESKNHQYTGVTRAAVSVKVVL